MASYPKRLIEVDLPIKQISAHARREKSIRHGHISTLHIWWARRPLAACRAVICAALWPDPVDGLCPPRFRDQATQIITAFGKKAGNAQFTGKLSEETSRRWIDISKGTLRLDATNPDDWPRLRQALLDFIADFANWDNSTHPDYLETSRALTQVAHEALGGEPGTRPLVVDPFAGGGSIPLEALRVGADAFASDLNPVAVLLNKVVLEYIPKYGQRLADEVRKWGQWVKEEAEKELAEFYPKDPDGSTPIAYLWARTIISEAPDDGTGIPVEVPLMRSLWLAKKNGRNWALRWIRDEKGKVKTETVEVTYANGLTRKVQRPLLEIFEPKNTKDVEGGTVAKGTATCPVTQYTTPVESVRRQIKEQRGGAADARLICVIKTKLQERGRFYTLPERRDIEAVCKANKVLEKLKNEHTGILSLLPDEPTPPDGTGSKGGGYRTKKYGIENFSDFFTPRQLLHHTIISFCIKHLNHKTVNVKDQEFYQAIIICLALAADKQIDRDSSFCRWISQNEAIGYTFGRQAIPMLWDFIESPGVFSTGGFGGIIADICETISIQSKGLEEISSGIVNHNPATDYPLPDDSVQCLITDPPYYDSVPYAELSDYFFVWLRRNIHKNNESLFSTELTPKQNECVVNLAENKDRSLSGAENFYESQARLSH